ncbi:MAG: TrmB family transcriptional regulator [Nanobdellota archaeon]
MKKQLQAIGFDEKEADIYIALLKLYKASVSEILNYTSIERRTIYDVLERLIQKGRASYFEENKTRKYQATNPKIILEDLKQKENEFSAIIPQLQCIKYTPRQAKVEILKGIQGLRTIFNEVIQSEKEHYVFGDINPLIYEDRYALTVKQFLKQIDEKNMKEKILYQKGDPINQVKNGEYRAVDEKDITPTPTLIYGNVVTQYIYTEPLTIIKITSKEVAKTHKQYFEHYWKQAKK